MVDINNIRTCTQTMAASGTCSEKKLVTKVHRPPSVMCTSLIQGISQYDRFRILNANKQGSRSYTQCKFKILDIS